MCATRKLSMRINKDNMAWDHIADIADTYMAGNCGIALLFGCLALFDDMFGLI